MDVEGKIKHLFDLFAKFGHENYIGEEVSQLQHAQVEFKFSKKTTKI